MLTFLDVARMVDATVMMGVLGWGGGDVNAAWRAEANRLGLRHVSVNHQKKEFVRKDRKKKGQKGSTMAGTQMLDRCWQSLKKFVGPHWPRKIGQGVSSKVHPDFSLF